MSSDYILTLEAIDRRLYSKDKSRPLARFSASDLSLPKGNHTGDGLSDECLTYMTELLTKHGRPNLQMNHFLFLHFGGWDALMDYIQADPKRRSFLLRCEEKDIRLLPGGLSLTECWPTEIRSRARSRRPRPCGVFSRPIF